MIVLNVELFLSLAQAVNFVHMNNLKMNSNVINVLTGTMLFHQIPMNVYQIQIKTILNYMAVSRLRIINHQKNMNVIYVSLNSFRY